MASRRRGVFRQKICKDGKLCIMGRGKYCLFTKSFRGNDLEQPLWPWSFYSFGKVILVRFVFSFILQKYISQMDGFCCRMLDRNDRAQQDKFPRCAFRVDCLIKASQDEITIGSTRAIVVMNCFQPGNCLTCPIVLIDKVRKLQCTEIRLLIIIVIGVFRYHNCPVIVIPAVRTG